MLEFPSKLLNEEQTLDAVLAGRSLARYGDGEIKLALGAAIKSQPADRALAAMLRMILKQPGRTLVGLPIPWPDSPKLPLWTRFAEQKVLELYDARNQYGSAFVTRPDSAPWIDTPDYWKKVRSLWARERVVLIRGSEKSLTKAMLPEAKSVEEIIAPAQGAFSRYRELYADFRDEKRRVLICLGPTATALAWALGNVGVHAVDLGHIGMFMRRRGV